MYHILIVDEEEHLLWALERNLFPDRQDIQVHTASSGEEGLEKLTTKPIDLLISDIKMPGAVDGFQLILRAKEAAPDARVMIITAFGTHRIQNFAERIGITHYIEKPFNVGELRDAILEVLDEKEGFQGVLSDLELTDIIQMLCLARRTALLHLKHKDHRGKIIFENGDVVHADFDDIQGSEAVFAMLALRQGDIFMQSDFDYDERTIFMGWQDMLLEGVRRADEHRHESGGYESAVADSSVGELSEASGAESTPQDDRFRKARTLTPHGLGAAVLFEDDSSQDAINPWQLEQASPWNGEVSVVEEDDEEEVRPRLAEASEAALLFSEDELNEMAMASEAAMEESTRVEMHADVSAAEIEVVAEAEVVAQVDDSQIQEEIPAPAYDDYESQSDYRAFAAPALNGRHDSDSHAVPGYYDILEKFARECPGLRVTGLVSPEKGLASGLVHAPNQERLDERAAGAYFSSIVSRAHQTVRALHGSDMLEELQIDLERDYVLMRAVANTQYFHFAIVDKTASLGIALVLMRQMSNDVPAAG